LVSFGCVLRTDFGESKPYHLRLRRVQSALFDLRAGRPGDGRRARAPRPV